MQHHELQKKGPDFYNRRIQPLFMNVPRTALIGVIALCVAAGVGHFSGRRHSPKALDLERVNAFLVQVLRRAEESPGQLQREIAERFSNQQIYLPAMTCRDWSDAGTDDPPGSLEDRDILVFCFLECLNVLKSREATIHLRSIFRDARVNDGWRLLWYESLGTDWLEKNPWAKGEP